MHSASEAADVNVVEPVRMRDLAAVDGRLARRNIAYLAGCWGTIGVAASVAALRPRWWTVAGAAIVISGRQHALLNVEHECIHNMFVPGGKVRNDRIGRWFCAAPSGSPFGAAKTTHLRHHRLLADGEDPDHELHAGVDKSTRRGLRRYFRRGLTGGYAVRVLTKRGGDDAGEGQRADPVDAMSIGAAQLSLWAISGSVLGWWVYPILWAGPLATLTSFWHLVRSFAEHAITAKEQAEHADRLITTESNAVERFCLAPYNMNYHAEHHRYPFVPAPRLPEVRDRLAGTPAGAATLVRRSYFSSMRTLYRSLP